MAKRSIKKANFSIGTVMKLGRKKTITQSDGTVITRIKRTRKRPDSPKKAKSAYIFFLQATFSQLKKDNPSLLMTDISTEVGAMWRKLAECERTKWNELARKDQERYQEELKLWKEKQ